MSARKSAKTVYLDTSAFIPLVEASHKLHKRVEAYLLSLEAYQAIDVVVLSEYLAGCDQNADRDFLVAKYTRQFRVPSFDARSAKVCSELFRILKSAGRIPRKGEERQITKADLMILADAIVNGADEFIFNDKYFLLYLDVLPKAVCNYPLPKFTKLSEVSDILVQPQMPGFEIA